MVKLILVLCSLAFLTGCSRVRIVELDPQTGKASCAHEGVRYYLPKPYLLVTEVPVEPGIPRSGTPGSGTPGSGAPGSGTPGSGTPGSGAPGSGAPGSGTPGSGAPGSGTPGSGAPGRGTQDPETPANQPPGNTSNLAIPTSNTSFGMTTKQYGIKLIYLPDFSKPMAIYIPWSMFGSAQMKPTLQDGWMLTSLDATSDTKTAETISAVASLVTAVGAAAASAAKKTMGITAPDGEMPPAQPYVLAPGLYEFSYGAKGELTGIQQVTIFDRTKNSPPPKQSGPPTKQCE